MLSSRKLTAGSSFTVVLAATAPMRDLFTIGRLLGLLSASLHAGLRPQLDISQLPESVHVDLLQLRFYAYCKQIGIAITGARQRTLFEESHNNSACLYPLDTVTIFEGSSLQNTVQVAVDKLATAYQLTSNRQISDKPFSRDIPHALLIARELIANSLQHSGTSVALVAVVAHHSSAAAEHREAISAWKGNVPSFLQILVADVGCGLLATTPGLSSSTLTGYLDLCPLPESHLQTKSNETLLLHNLLLGVREAPSDASGRGFSLIRDILSWFGGSLRVHTGRSEYGLRHDYQQRPIGTAAQSVDTYIPGVVAVATLPSAQLHSASVVSRYACNDHEKPTRNPDCDLLRIDTLLLEDAKAFADEMVRTCGKLSEVTCSQRSVYGVSVGDSTAITTDHIIAALTTLCLHPQRRDEKAIDPLQRLFFFDVPRPIVRSLLVTIQPSGN